MISCQTCGAEFYPGTLFCKECGRFLLKEVDQVDRNTPEPERKLYFLIPSSHRQGKLDTNVPIWIGRADPDDQFWPQLDLTDDGGIEMGVSRRHALIRKEEKGLVIVDQFSVNGTWIDRQKLVPDQPYLLPDAAKVRFGSLPVQLFLE
jgi:pSer/pThr/pTyr-binding forkhead associated (FHA) protein